MISPTSATSVLLLDDHVHAGPMYRECLHALDREIQVELVQDAQEALEIAQRQLFDILVIDVKIAYRGSDWAGGVRVAMELKNRYGSDSIILISQERDSERFCREHGFGRSFLGKLPAPQGTCAALLERIGRLRQDQFAFVGMPYAGEFRELRERIRAALRESGLRCVLADEEPGGHTVTERVRDLVRKAKLAVIVADGGRQFVYYESALGHAWHKEVLVLTSRRAELDAALSDRHVIEYGDDAERITAELARRIRDLRLVRPAGV